MTEDERRRWNARAERGGYAPGQRPARVVRRALDELPAGRVLDLATGEGRNAIFLADRGWTVDAIDISTAMLDRARERARSQSVDVNWILADLDDYCFPEGVYDAVTISYFDARHRLPAVKAALASGGVLCYQHHLTTATDGPSERYRFEPGELRTACSDLSVEHYEEDRDGNLVRLLARRVDP
ncbi:class I SAM-dependent methyltransferase [Halovivax gelatinilyticus]|uniref:class I SAM-dependent methyltransferase n=1 Tax=Halovivax gelatinilyticus TaxID=2961597 RepID=UPI0020CA5001|nr:class I SAM-dependent methyltransferase [Halovivax gelatinilyticus]